MSTFDKFLTMVLIIFMVFVVLLIIVTFSGCHPDECRLHELRCAGQTAQVCDADRRWDDVMDCDEIWDPAERTWTCCELDGGVQCLPEEECFD